MDNVYAIIMAGGRGERFWPLSTEERPKPYLCLFGEKTLFQATVERITPFIPEERIFPVLSRQHLALAKQQAPTLPESNHIIEPEGKDTAACIGLASLYLERLDPEAITVVLPADHYISNNEEFISTLKQGIEFLKNKDCIVIIGIKPTRPETDYGYLEIGKELTPGVFEVVKFLEKPSPTKAKEFLTDRYWWNSGIFIWRNSFIQSLICRFMPELWRTLLRIRESIGKQDEEAVLKMEFAKLQKVSIDYGVLEKAEERVAVLAKFYWDDVGNWTALARIKKAEVLGNISIGEHKAIDTQNCIVYAHDAPITTLGVSDLIIVSANNKVLVCSKERAQEIKKLLNSIKDED